MWLGRWHLYLQGEWHSEGGQGSQSHHNVPKAWWHQPKQGHIPVPLLLFTSSHWSDASFITFPSSLKVTKRSCVLCGLCCGIGFLSASLGVLQRAQNKTNILHPFSSAALKANYDGADMKTYTLIFFLYWLEFGYRVENTHLVLGWGTSVHANSN